MILLQQHFSALKRAFSQLVLSPMSTFISLVAISIALTLPAFGYLLLESADFFGQKMGLHEITLFLDKNADDITVLNVSQELEKLPLRFQFIDKQTAFAHLSESLHLAQVAKFLDENPLPHAFVITPENQHLDAVQEMQHTFETWPEVARVHWDSAWVERFEAFLDLSGRLMNILAFLLSAGLIAIIFNNVRLQIMFYKDEIEVAAMMGATRAFISAPFYYFGALLGLLGAILSAIILQILISYLNPAVQHFSQYYALPLSLHPVDFSVFLSLAGVAMFLGLLAVNFSVSLFVRQQ